MEYKKFDDSWVLRLEKGEEIIESLTAVCEKEKIDMGMVSGIGAISEVEIGLFDPKKREYHSQKFQQPMEILSLNGNISQMNGKVYLHVHIILGDESLHAWGGHLNYAKISATAEIIIQRIHGLADRKFSNEIGLNLLHFS